MAGEPGWTSRNERPTACCGSQATMTKTTTAKRTFIAAPAARIACFVRKGARTKERGSSESPSSPSSFTKPPIGSQLSV